MKVYNSSQYSQSLESLFCLYFTISIEVHEWHVRHGVLSLFKVLLFSGRIFSLGHNLPPIASLWTLLSSTFWSYQVSLRHSHSDCAVVTGVIYLLILPTAQNTHFLHLCPPLHPSIGCIWMECFCMHTYSTCPYAESKML